MVQSGYSVDRQGDLKPGISPYCEYRCLGRCAFEHVVLLREVDRCVGARRIAETEARIQGGSRLMAKKICQLAHSYKSHFINACKKTSPFLST